MAQVSHAERWVNGECRQTFASGASTPDGVVSATLEMARYFMNIQMLTDGHLKEFNVKFSTIEQICKSYLAEHHKAIDYASSASDFHLPSLEG